MTRSLAPSAPRDHGRTLYGGEPTVFHCNFYNYWLQKTLLLDPELEMERVIQSAAAEAVTSLLHRGAAAVKADSPEQRLALARDTFAELGFGTIDLSGVTADGGVVHVPVSHYGQCFRQVVEADFATPQSLFDAGFARAAAAFVHGVAPETFEATIEACASMGAPAGRIRLDATGRAVCFDGYAHEAHTAADPGAPYGDTSVDEAAILGALATLDFSGNEEGLIPRFGVMLTRHFASFYNRVSFEFLRRMDETGLVDAAEMLLTDTGYRCAFHTFGGIMTSAEWDAVIRPQCSTKADWVHGMVATVNALGWGVWRVAELSDERVVVRIYDDYESCGQLDMYGRSSRPVSHLAAAGVAGTMNLVYCADIHEKPTLDLDFYARAFEQEGLFQPEQTRSMAMGDPYTEIVATRS
jgi:hypothetical protein